MKLTTALLASLVLATAPAGAQWVKGCDSIEAAVYIDPATIHKDGALRRIQMLYDLKARGTSGELSVSALHEFDCEHERWRILSSCTYAGPMASDAVIQSDASVSEWYAPIPGTPTAACFKFVCPRVRLMRLPS